MTQESNATSFPVALTIEQEAKLDVLATKLDAVIAAKQDIVATGNITTQNLVPTGTATANSAVEIDTAGKGSLSIQVSGVYTGVLSVQGRVHSSAPWVTLSGGSLLIRDTAAYSATIASAATGIFQADCAGFAAVRVTGLAAMTGTATVYIRAIDEVALTALDTSLPAGSAALGSVTVTSALVAGTNAIGGVTLRPDTGQGSSTYHHRISTADSNLVNVKNAAGVIGTLHLSNAGATGRWFKLYNKASAPVVASDTPVGIIWVPANQSIPVNTGPFGDRFTTGISYAIVSGIANTDAQAAAANEIAVFMVYT